jgi:hypothetical protein
VPGEQEQRLDDAGDGAVVVPVAAVLGVGEDEAAALRVAVRLWQPRPPFGAAVPRHELQAAIDRDGGGPLVAGVEGGGDGFQQAQGSEQSVRDAVVAGPERLLDLGLDLVGTQAAGGVLGQGGQLARCAAGQVGGLAEQVDQLGEVGKSGASADPGADEEHQLALSTSPARRSVCSRSPGVRGTQSSSVRQAWRAV